MPMLTNAISPEFVASKLSATNTGAFSPSVSKYMSMARGWESKDVEAQVESKESPKAFSGHDPKTAEQQVREQDIKQLQLSRTRIANDLATATHPNHRKSLEAALAHLDKKISDLS
jgi:hypothetical protein